MVPVPKVRDINELNYQLLMACRKYRDTHKVESRTQTVAQAYAEEVRFLHAIPSYRYDTSRKATPNVGDYSTIRFDKNNYSVPVRYLRKTVTVKGFANEVHIMHNGELIATYERSYGTGKTQFRLEHYIDLIERKPRCVFQARPVRETVTQELIEWGKLLPGGNAEMVKLLRLCVDYGEEKILSIRESLPKGIIPTVDMVRSQLHEPVETNIVYFSNEISIMSTDLKKIDEKCGVG